MDSLALPGERPVAMEVFDVGLLKGLSGFMYGFGSPARIMNYVLKRPTDENLFAVDVGYRPARCSPSTSTWAVAPATDQRLGYRINLVQEQGGTFTLGSLDRTVASLATDLRADRTSSSVSIPSMPVASPMAMPSGVWDWPDLDLPTAIDPRTRQQPEGAYFSNENIVVSTGLEWQLNPDWKSSFNYRYAREDVDYVYGDISINDALGNSSTQVWRALQFPVSAAAGHAGGKLKTGAIAHQLVFGASRQQYGCSPTAPRPARPWVAATSTAIRCSAWAASATPATPNTGVRRSCRTHSSPAIP
jgi:iron complex outermembrane receptor protein